MAITTTREQRRLENHERALAAYMEHHAAAVALIAASRSPSPTTTWRPTPRPSAGAPSARWRRRATTSRP